MKFEVKVVEAVDADVAQVWELIAELEAIEDWYDSSVSSCEVQGSGVGAIRHCILQDGVELREEITSIDERLKSLTYSVVEHPFEIENLETTITVFSNGTETLVSWNSEFSALDDVHISIASSILQSFYIRGIASLDSTIQSEAKLAEIKRNLLQVGVKYNCSTPEDLGQIDHFHIGGLVSTKAVQTELALNQEDKLLDVGSGLGGPARFFASEGRCETVALECNEVFRKISVGLTRLCRLEHLVREVPGVSEELPFSDATYTKSVLIHVHMFLWDVGAAFSEVSRVLKTEGKIVLFEPVLTSDSPGSYPLPWSKDASSENLLTQFELLQMLEVAGFTIDKIEDQTNFCLKTLEMAKDRADSRLNLSLILGGGFKNAVNNVEHDIRNGRIGVRLISATKRPKLA